ncbi:MAG: TonB-dependent receptor, partial [Dysgonamonadaceae bacterium]|nr:TonB-dependent receptor [Dysgonamonadaceae bacterium]
GATVQVKGTTQGTVTDMDGNFTISAPAGGTLVISYVGYRTQEVPVSANVMITLVPDSEMLEDLVVTGFGVQRRASFTGAASVISTAQLENVPSVSLSSRLAGAAAGVSVGAASGQPGAVESLRIRGTGSVNASSEPLYVIDGVPMISNNLSGFSYSHSGNSALSTINANDIESITIIKDAAAASLYGSRAANGVVVITTKSGRAGKTNITFRSDWGFSNIATEYRPTLGGDDRRELLHHGLVNFRLINTAGSTLESANAWADSQINTYAEKPANGWEDWRSLLLRNGSQQNYEVSMSGGNERTTFFSSLSYSSIEGITLQSSLERITGRLNFTHKVTDRLSFNANVTIADSKQDVNSEGTSFSSPIMAVAMTTSPQDFAFNPDGSYNITRKFRALGNPRANPLYTASLNYDKSDVTRFMGTTSADFKITDWITFRERISYDFSQTNNRVWWDPRSNDGFSSSGVFQRFMMNRATFVSQSQFLFSHTFDGLHSFDGVLAYETEEYKYDYTYTNGSNFPSDRRPEIINAGTTRGTSYYDERRMVSYIGMINYNYDNRYYLGTSFRRDGSSKFRRDNRWGNFWSVSGSWRLSQEEFAQSFAHIVSDARIRGSYGTNGNQPIDNYGYMDLYGFGFNYNGNPGSAPSSMPYPQLTWEKNRQLNIGLDFSLFQRFNVTFDWYNRWADDLLLRKTLSQTTGFNNMLMNVGSMRNKGIDLSITSTNIRNNDFTWTTTLNLNHNKNRLTDIGAYSGTGTPEYISPASARLIHRVGQPFNSIYAFEYAGVDPETGREMFFTNTGDNPRATTINSAEARQVIIGKVDPDLMGGLTNNLSYKNLDLGFTFTFTLGGNLYDNASWINSNGGTMQYDGNVPAYNKIQDMWTPDNKNATLPRFVFQNPHVASSRWMHSSDHLRLKNVTLGYSLPRNLVEQAKLNRVRLYASAVNLLTFKSSNLPFDPEPPVNPRVSDITMGIVTYQTPPLRTVTFGIEVSF